MLPQPFTLDVTRPCVFFIDAITLITASSGYTLALSHQSVMTAMITMMTKWTKHTLLTRSTKLLPFTKAVFKACSLIFAPVFALTAAILEKSEPGTVKILLYLGKACKNVCKLTLSLSRFTCSQFKTVLPVGLG